MAATKWLGTVALAILSLAATLNLAAAAVATTPKKPAQQNVTIEINYESLCPDSQRFINEQLFPTYQVLGKYITVEFVVYGKASFGATGDGGWSFTCQHGPEECVGNLYQTCLLSKLSDQDKSVSAVNCIMADATPQNATEKCMKQVGITSPTYDDVNQCRNSLEGQNLLHANGVLTKSLEPPLYFVPWIIFNGKWNKQDMDASLANLPSILCKKYLPNVPECAKFK